ncbi:MAG: nucleotidyltransferase domain-containing protein [Nitrospirae bacterium]|nr:nucleotidyltransferase domain-containing protein [Nitrospirota bacterium]
MAYRTELADTEIRRMKKDLAAALGVQEKISFAYLHGSFGRFPFRDIDIGAYCLISEEEVFDFELEMSTELERVTGYSVDFKVLNYAPIGFQFSVIHEGDLLFERDRALRLDFVEATGLKYMDYYELSKSYFKELMECLEK